MSDINKQNTYQRQYREQKKLCQIVFTLEQHKFLDIKAKLASKPLSTFIREQVLASAKKEYVLPFDTQTHQVKVLLIRYGTNLNQLSYLCNSSKKISPEVIEQVRANFLEMQTGIMKIYNAPIEVKELVRHTLIKNPDYREEIEKILKQLKK